MQLHLLFSLTILQATSVSTPGSTPGPTPGPQGFPTSRRKSC